MPERSNNEALLRIFAVQRSRKPKALMPIRLLIFQTL